MQIAPSLHLRGLVKHYLIIDQQAPKEPIYRFFPDGNPGLVFSYADPLLEYAPQKPASGPVNHFTYGQASQYHDLKAGKVIGLLIVVLQPWGLHALSGVPGTLTLNTRLSLDQLFKPAWVDALQANLMACSTHRARIRELDAFLGNLISAPLTPEAALIQRAVQRIDHANGLLPVNQLTDGLYITERSLERRFEQVMGIGPKQFSRIVRLQHCLKLHRQRPTLSLTELAYSAGYYDQSHFIREFGQLAGITPKQYEANTNRLAANLTPIAP